MSKDRTAYRKAYYEAHKEKMIAQSKAYYKANQTKIDARTKAARIKLHRKINKKELKEGKCRRCGKPFLLEDWQHSTLHWCRLCRQTPEYKNFSEASINEEMGDTEEKI